MGKVVRANAHFTVTISKTLIPPRAGTEPRPPAPSMGGGIPPATRPGCTTIAGEYRTRMNRVVCARRSLGCDRSARRLAGPLCRRHSVAGDRRCPIRGGQPGPSVASHRPCRRVRPPSGPRRSPQPGQVPLLSRRPPHGPAGREPAEVTRTREFSFRQHRSRTGSGPGLRARVESAAVAGGWVRLLASGSRG